MAPNLVHAADVSAYSQATPIMQSQWAQMMARGYTLAIVGSWHGTHGNINAEGSLEAAQSVGMDVATYIVLNGMDGAKSVEQGLDFCGDAVTDLKFVALDVEEHGITKDIFGDAVHTVQRLGHTPIVYTSLYEWANKVGNVMWGKDLGLPLWNALYTDTQVPALTLGHSYGGWYQEDLVGRQWKGTNTRLGVSADLNVFDGDWLAAL